MMTRVAKGRSNRVGSGQKVDPKNRPDFWPFFDLFRPFKNEEIPTKVAQNSSYRIKSFKIFYLLSLMGILCIIFCHFWKIINDFKHSFAILIKNIPRPLKIDPFFRPWRVDPFTSTLGSTFFFDPDPTQPDPWPPYSRVSKNRSLGINM